MLLLRFSLVLLVVQIEGDNTKPAPGFFSGFEDTAKWNAWTAQKGKSKEDAMKEYIAEVERQLVAYA